MAIAVAHEPVGPREMGLPSAPGACGFSARLDMKDALSDLFPVGAVGLRVLSGVNQQTEELISQAVATWSYRTYRRSPLIIPVIIDA